MGKPIRDRGIRWVEMYGDKSAYLRKRMHDEIGPGSYFRWEGHDSTTGNDYYVVVSPGFSKKKGYFFFAGLRKMPADHGASGKKFATQAEALTHAFETWAVPRPEIKPAKPYNQNDLVNKPIIMEVQHNTASSIPRRIIVADRMEREAMALGPVMRACGMGSNWQRLTTQKHYASMLCGAIQQSGTMGFLAGMYNQLSIVGIDGHNQSARSELPYSPMVATCQEADPQGVGMATAPDWRIKPLYELPRGGKKYIFHDPRRDDTDDGYKHLRWRDVKVGLVANIPYRLYHRAGELISKLQAMGRELPGQDAVEISLPHVLKDETSPVQQINQFLRGQEAARSRGKRALDANSSIRMTINVAPELYLKAKNLISQFNIDGMNKSRITPYPSDPTKSLALIIDQLAAEKNMTEGMPFDPDQVIAEKSKVEGSQFFYYDDHGLPIMLSGKDKGLALVPRSTEDKPSDSGTLGGQFKNSLNGAKQLVADQMVPGLNALGQEYLTLLSKQQEFRATKKANPNGPMLAPMALEIGEMTKRLEAMAINLKSRPGGRDQARQQFVGLCDEYIRQRVRAAELSGSNKEVNTKKMDDALKMIQPYLLGFRAMADLGLVDINPKRYVYAQTCAPVQSQIFTKAYDTTPAGIPKDPSSLAQVQGPRPIIPETRVSAARSGDSYIGRQYVRTAKGWEEDLVPVQDSQAHQMIAGAPLHVMKAEQSALFHGDKDGSPSFLTRKATPRLDPNSNGRFIPGGAYALLARPVGHSPMKSGAGRDFGGGWEVMQEDFWASESGGIPKGSRQQRPKKLALPAPDKENQFYDVLGPDGDPMNVSDSVVQDQNGMRWKDFGALAAFMKSKFCLPDDVMGCVTSTTSSDLFTTKDFEETAKYVYNTVSKYKEAIRNPVFRRMIEVGEGIASGSPPPADMTAEQAKAARDAFMLSQEAQVLMKDPEHHALYEFGSFCKFCDKVEEGGMGDTISPKVIAMLEVGMEDPRESLRPKAGKLYGVKLTTTDAEGKPVEQWLKNPGDEDPMLFSSRFSPWLKQYLQHYQTTTPEANARIETYADNDVLVQSVKRTKNLVQGREKLENMIYAQRGEEPPAEPWEDDVTYALRAEEEPQKEEQLPGTEPEPEPEPEQEPLQEIKPEQPPQPEPQPQPVAQPEPIPEPRPQRPTQQTVQTLKMMLTPVFNQLKGVDLQNLQAAPPEVLVKAKRTLDRALNLIQMNPELAPHLDSALATLGLDKLKSYEKPIPPAVSKTVQKLVKLANTLDDQGKYDEAEVVDKVIAATMEKSS